MEKVEGLLKDLKFTEKERKGLKIGWSGSGKAGVVEPQALAKLFSEKPAFREAMVETVGRIWCPIWGVDCEEVGENIFSSLLGSNRGGSWHWRVDHGSLGMICWYLRIMWPRNA